jgi:mono/diheme cytochrome c family protein
VRAKDCGAAILILVIGFIPASHGYAQNPPAAAAAGIFKAKCAICHAADLSGNTPMGKKLSIPDLRAAEVRNQPDAELIGTITKGMKKMPAFEGKLTKEQIASLVAYIREMAQKH